MKRIGYLFDQIVDMDNLILADKKARRKKHKSYGVRLWDKNREANFQKLQQELISGTYRTSEYSIYTVYEPKEREIYRLPYRDRIVHHAIMNILEPIWVKVFTKDTYACIKKRGVHKAMKAARAAMIEDPTGTQYCLKIDIKKFYPSINHGILKQIIRKKIKCKRTLALLDEIIDSAPGVPIGNYLSQFFANLYLAYFDHQMKEERGVKHYFRYADDIVILAKTKAFLHAILGKIRIMLSSLKLRVKENYQVFPTQIRGLDFVGYVIREHYVLLRKSIKKRFARKVAKGYGPGSHQWNSYSGWASHCSGRNIIKTLTKQYEIKYDTRSAA